MVRIDAFGVLTGIRIRGIKVIMLGWKELEDKCTACMKCDLGRTRTNIVIERGSRTASLMLIGEGPGKQEDEQGKPFVGAAGQLLDLLLSGLMFDEDEYYICNVVKCRPPSNRTPTEDEALTCLPWLRNQVALIKPRIMVCMGSTAMKYIIDKDAKITQIRGQWIERKGFWIMPTFHPAALLRDGSKKSLLFEDMKKVRSKLSEIDADT
jgi:DNA polymerase